MSYAEDQDWFGLEDVALEAEQDEQFNLENGIWVTREGIEIKISEMKTTHIRNCIGMLTRRTDRWRKEYLPLLFGELEKRNLKY